MGVTYLWKLGSNQVKGFLTASTFRYGSILIQDTLSPMVLSSKPEEEAV
jgi:hypothetical protein